MKGGFDPAPIVRTPPADWKLVAGWITVALVLAIIVNAVLLARIMVQS